MENKGWVGYAVVKTLNWKRKSGSKASSYEYEWQTHMGGRIPPAMILSVVEFQQKFQLDFKFQYLHFQYQ